MAGFISRKKEFQEAAEAQIEKALEMCGMVAESHTKDKCPVDTGKLRNSISHKVVPDNKAVFIGTNVNYAPYVELGTGSFYKGGTPGIKGQKAQPYLKPAVANHRNEYNQILNYLYQQDTSFWHILQLTTHTFQEPFESVCLLPPEILSAYETHIISLL